jgi:hypothetical protein
MYMPKAWQAQSASWCAIAQRDVARSLILLSDALGAALAGTAPLPAATHSLTDVHRTLRRRLATLHTVEPELRAMLGIPADDGWHAVVAAASSGPTTCPTPDTFGRFFHPWSPCIIMYLLISI